MPYTLQNFLATSATKSAAELVAAYLRLPEDRRTWSPEDKSRSALDQFAECAILNGYTAKLIQTHVWPSGGFDNFLREKSEASALSWEDLSALLEENTRLAVEIISALPDEELEVEIDLPWGKSSLAEILAYPYWNMTYHQGQINYIASMLGCLG